MSAIETAVENLIQSHIDENDFITRADVEQYYEEQDFVCRLDAEQYTDSEVNDARADMESELGELQSRIEALEEKALEAAPAAVEQEPRTVNQIEWLMGIGSDSIFAGFDTMETLEEYVRSSMVADNKGDRAAQANMVIMMTLATARNLINEKLEAES